MGVGSHLTVFKTLKIWAPFGLSTLLSVAGYKWGYAVPGWLAWLTCVAVISLFCGVWAVQHTGIRFWSIAVVVVGLAIGQWWLIEFVIVIVSGKIRGFAP
jgi:hypothetical protein